MVLSLGRRKYDDGGRALLLGSGEVNLVTAAAAAVTPAAASL